MTVICSVTTSLVTWTTWVTSVSVTTSTCLVTSLSIVSGSDGVVVPHAAAMAKTKTKGTTVNTLAFQNRYFNMADPPISEMLPG
jgi:hypothetical protein